MQTVSLQRFGDECLKHAYAGRLTILAGAGVSMLPPTQLPSALKLKRMAVEAMCDTPGLRRYARCAVNAPGFSSLVLEILFQHLYECFSDQLYPFFDVLTGSQPNLAHKVLAKLHEEFDVPILTTNFDTLIEQQQTQSKPIIHLHGDLVNRKEMVVRIQQVGRGLSRVVEQSAGRLIRHRALCVLGYSGSDEDIRALLRQYRPTQTFWLVRQGDRFVAENLERSFSYLNVVAARGDLAVLTRKWAAAIRCSARVRTKKTAGTNPSDLWRGILTWEDRCAGISELMFDLEQYRVAAQVALLGYRKCRHGERASWFLAQAADAYKILGDTPAALTHAKRALAAAKRDLWDSALALNVRGLAYLEQHKTNPARALPFFRRAAKAISTALRQRHPPETGERMRSFAALVFNNVGLASMQLGKDSVAERAFLKSVKLKEKNGDLIGIATTSANLARLNYRRKKHAAAHKWKRRSLYLVERYDRKFTKAYLLRSLGGLACQQGRVQQGLKSLHEALEIYRDLLGDGLGSQLTKEIIERFSKPT